MKLVETWQNDSKFKVFKGLCSSHMAWKLWELDRLN